MSNVTGFSIETAHFGTTKNGQEVTQFTLRNVMGMQVKLINYGGIVTDINVPDKEGNTDNVVVGYSTLGEYEADPFYLGAIVGRYANRIAHGRLNVAGKTRQLDINNGPNCLHGGNGGFHKVVWQAQTISNDDYVGVKLLYTSPDGDSGFPGQLETIAEYRLYKTNKLALHFTATTDALTPVSLTQHGYFNLAGQGSALKHELWLASEAITPVDEDINPTGELMDTSGTPFDFSAFKAIGQHIDEAHPQLALAGGYDHNFAVTHHAQHTSVQAKLRDPQSGRAMTLSTNSPGMQLYTVNLDEAVVDSNGSVVMEPRGAVCLEPQHFPNAPNQENFPSPWLAPGEQCEVTFEYEFTTY